MPGARRFRAVPGAMLLAFLLCPSAAEGQTSRCRPIPSAGANAITIAAADAQALSEAVQRAIPGSTILLADGTYRLRWSLIVRAAGVTIRSASGNARAVVLDGGYQANELIAIEASGVTIANVTLTRAVDHLVHLVPAPRSTIRGIRLSGLRLIDAGEQFIKANPDAGRTAFVDDAVVECSGFQLTEDGRGHIETLGGTSCYTGGVDVHASRGWVVRFNRFEGLFCRTGFLAEHAVHFWQNARDTIVENNVIVNCARGIGFGLGAANPPLRQWDDVEVAGYAGHLGGLIRNNVIYADIAEYDTGIGLEQARDVRVLHNTVFAGPGATKAFSSIDLRFANTRASVHNNLVNNITRRADPGGIATHNLEGVSAADFVDAAGLDFHLRAGSKAIDAGLVLDDGGEDLDGQPRGSRPDIGADESGVPGFRGSAVLLLFAARRLGSLQINDESGGRRACSAGEAGRSLNVWPGQEFPPDSRC
jgi:hypothetical protein